MALTLIDVEIRSGDVDLDVVQAGETITNGEAVYRSTDSLYYLADNNTSTVTAEAVGVAVTEADAAEDYFVLLTVGTVMLTSTTLAVGTTYCLGSTPGSIETYAEVTSGGSTDYVTVLGVGVSTSELELAVNATGAFKA